MATVRSDAYNTGRSMGEALNNTKAGKAINNAAKAGAKGAWKGGGTGMLLEFGVRSVNNIYNDVIRGSK